MRFIFHIKMRKGDSNKMRKLKILPLLIVAGRVVSRDPAVNHQAILQMYVQAFRKGRDLRSKAALLLTVLF